MQAPIAPISYQPGRSWQFSSYDWRPHFSCKMRK